MYKDNEADKVARNSAYRKVLDEAFVDYLLDLLKNDG